jgi:4-amino-4-deoxy-L-arabinose transferase-like glycosyltransferase
MEQRTRRLVAAVTLLHLGLLVTWSLMVPTFRAPDEHVHHDMVRHLTTTWSYPDYDGLQVSRRTMDALGTSPAFPAHAAPVAADAAQLRSERPAWRDLGPDVRNGAPNQMPQHPPLYYVAAGAAVRALDGGGSTPLDLAVWQLRLLGALVVAPLPLIAADIARRFTTSGAVVVAAAAAVLAVPQLTHITSAVSNDGLMVLLGSLTLAGVARIATGDRRWGVAVATGVVAGLALLTKGFAIPLVPAVALACLLPLLRRSQDEPGEVGTERPGTTLGRAALVAAIAFAVGGWWWVRNVVRHGTPQPGVRLRERVEGVEHDVVEFAGDWSERIVTSFWGSFGWFEVRLPLGVSIALTVVVAVTVLAACWRSWARLVLLVPVVAATAMVLSSGWGAFKKTGVSYATQGRYLFAGVVGLAALASLGTAQLLRRSSWWQPAATLALALAVQAGGLWVSLDRYYAGDGPVERLRALVAFAPVPGWFTAGVLAGTVAIGAATLAGAVATAARSRTS